MRQWQKAMCWDAKRYFFEWKMEMKTSLALQEEK